MREPLQQVISHFQYTKDHPEKFEYLPAGINSLLDFASCPYGYNLQTRFISGIDNLYGREEEALKLAGQHLQNDFELIGLTEEFDLSLLMLGRAMQWKICYYVRGNTGIARQAKPAPSKRELSELRQILAPDIALYQEARQLFEVQTQKWPDLVKRLPSFQRENHYFQKLNPTYIRLKQLFKG
ncbi:MAG: hypothetical protein U5L96_06245 [Owenweeksia sp.]|nr:hypothetical protein [Owenweeksia sp.]